jgi:hypothetical protein
MGRCSKLTKKVMAVAEKAASGGCLTGVSHGGGCRRERLCLQDGGGSRSNARVKQPGR